MMRPVFRPGFYLGLVLLTILAVFGFWAGGNPTASLAAPMAGAGVGVLPTAPMPASFPITVKVVKSANVRSGPGTEYAVISGARPGQRLSVIDCNLDCSWYKLAEDCWIAAFLVQPEVPVVASQSTPTAAASPVITSTVASTGVTSPQTPSVIATPATNVNSAQQSPQQPTKCPQTNGIVNTYAGPGTFYALVDTRPAGECIAVIGRNSAGDWFQMSHGMWIAASAILYAEPIETMPITDRIFTATPEPTPTPWPTATPTPVSIGIGVVTSDISADELLFVTEAQNIFVIYSGSFSILGKNLSAAGDNPALIFSDVWRAETGTAIALIYNSNIRLRALVPPARFANAWAEVLVAADQYDLAMSALVLGLDSYDIAQIELASQYMTEGQNAVNRAAALLPLE